MAAAPAPPASPRPDEAKDLDENLDPGQIEQFVNVLLAYEAGVRNHDMSNADKHKDTRALVQSYDRFLSLVQTLRQQALSARWDAGVRRAIDASWGYHEVTSTVKAAANVMAVDEQVKTLRNGPTVACMLCNQSCEAGSMRFFNLFGQRPPYEECERAGPLGAFSADAWIKANLSDLHAMWERLEDAYRCEDMKDEMNCMSQTPSQAMRELPAEALGTVAVGADCARMFETAMFLQTLPIVLMHDIALRLEREVAGRDGILPRTSKSIVVEQHGKEMAAETLRELELVKRALARPGVHGPLPESVGVPRVQELYAEYESNLAELLVPAAAAASQPPARSWRRSVVVHDDDDVPPPIEILRSRYARLLGLTGARARRSFAGSAEGVVEGADGREEDERDESDRPNGQASKRKRAAHSDERTGRGKRAAAARVADAVAAAALARCRVGASRRAARASGRACRRVLEDEATGEGFAETCDEASDHDDVERAEELREFRDTQRAHRRSLETHEEEQMANGDAIDHEGFSAAETSAALAASQARVPTPPAAEAPVQPLHGGMGYVPIDEGAGVVPPAAAPAPAPAPAPVPAELRTAAERVDARMARMSSIATTSLQLAADLNMQDPVFHREQIQLLLRYATEIVQSIPQRRA